MTVASASAWVLRLVTPRVPPKTVLMILVGVFTRIVLTHVVSPGCGFGHATSDAEMQVLLLAVPSGVKSRCSSSWQPTQLAAVISKLLYE